jgi:hypothetical protein
MGKKYKSIMKDEMGGYHSQMNKMKTNDTSAIMKVKKRKAVF